ncbi:MAG: cadmium-translocating P-type ATPase [Bacteroidetes bacterium]|nr:cadmium-translocating P-type ATPase [Bacteroidota bacterium]
MTTKKHIHQYDSNGKQICCSLEEKIDAKTPPPLLNTAHSIDDGHDHSHDHSQGSDSIWKEYLPAIISFALLISGIAMDYFDVAFFNDWVRLVWYVVAYIPVGFPVIKMGFNALRKGEVFTEFFLMSIATIGAFAIGEYPEGVAVMLFYAVGELFQGAAVRRAKDNIKALLDVRPQIAHILKNGTFETVHPEEVTIGDTIQVKVGEIIPLDGKLLSDKASLNTAAITGESKPQSILQNENVLAGSINMEGVIEIKVTKIYKNSSISRILDLVQNATSKKAKTELLIRRLAKIYTPIVVFLAVLVCFLPYFFVDTYVFQDWLYRALIFLVISCPCALVISIPLVYFGGIGAASRNGILVKGSNFLDVLANIQNVVMDKTGTMTEGVFKVQEVVFDKAFNQNAILQMVDVLESHSTHPVATAIHEYVGKTNNEIKLENTEEIAGHGLKAEVNGKQLLVGNFKLMNKFNIQHDVDVSKIVYTVIAVAYDNKFVGYLTVADSIKQDSQNTIDKLKMLNVKPTMLSGDKSTVVKYVAEQLGIANAFGDLLPEDKVSKVKEIKAKNETVAFVGDGVNDAPVVALSDVGIAMGGLGSDATIETADVVIQDDKPSKIPMAINIGKQTKKIVWQNITLAFVVKGIVLILGAGGLATMWEAVFADVGVALLAILNAVRIQRMKF